MADTYLSGRLNRRNHSTPVVLRMRARQRCGSSAGRGNLFAYVSNDPVNLRLSHAIPCNNAKGAVHVGIDYALQFGPRPYDPSQVPRHQRRAAQQFEAWSAARA